MCATWKRPGPVAPLRRLRRQHPEVRLARGQRAPAMDWLSPDGYVALVRRHGFDVAYCALDEVQMTLRSFQDIGHYWLFIEGALPGAPLAAGAEALEHGPARSSLSAWTPCGPSRAGGSS